MGSYTQLTKEARYQIYALLQAGHKKTEIASLLGRHKSTIGRELERNHGLRGYRPKQAQRLADDRRKEKVQTRIPDETWEWVKQLLLEDWSPEQISGWLSIEKGMRVSHEWIYLFIYQNKRQGGDLHRHLRCQKARRKRYGSNDRRGQIIGRVSIDARPGIVNERSRVGDWEADTVIGKLGGTVLVTLAERKTRYSVIALSPDKSAQAVKEALIASLRPHVNHVHTLTYDNGKEFAYHETIATELDAKGFFAHPYHSWERGLNENTNGLIRQYLPKGTDFQSLSQLDIKKIMDKLNNRPRKCLGFKTPNQVFNRAKSLVALTS
jgi:IS30 family transposase